MNSPADSAAANNNNNNMNAEEESFRLSQLSADLDLFEFFDMEGEDDLFESANDGSFDLDNFMDVQMEEFEDPTNDDTRAQGHSSCDESFKSALNYEEPLDESFITSASSSPEQVNSSSSAHQANNQYSEAHYNSALQKLAESMKRTEESRRYVMQMQREMLTESQKKALSSAKEQLRQQNQMQQQQQQQPSTPVYQVRRSLRGRRNSSAMSSIISAGSQTVGRYMYRQQTM